MLNLLRPRPGPRRLDEHQAKRVQDKTLSRYRAAARPFADWLVDQGLAPAGADDWDDCLVEFKNEHALSYAAFAQLVSAVEFFFPRFKSHLGWSHAVLSGMTIAHTPKHTVPCGRHHCRFLGAHFAAKGHYRLGLGMPVQQHLGLRPGELINLLPGDLLVSSEAGAAGPEHIVFRLGARRGTKAKREQYAVLHKSAEPVLYNLVVQMRALTPLGCPLFPVSLDTYRRLIRATEAELKLSIGWGPHSPRAGFATDAVAAGLPFTEIQERGRWLSPSSLRTYIDVVTAISVSSQVNTARLKEAVAWTDQNFEAYFPAGCFRWPQKHAAKGQQEVRRRALPHSGEATAEGSHPGASKVADGGGRRVRFA